MARLPAPGAPPTLHEFEPAGVVFDVPVEVSIGIPVGAPGNLVMCRARTPG